MNCFKYVIKEKTNENVNSIIEIINKCQNKSCNSDNTVNTVNLFVNPNKLCYPCKSHDEWQKYCNYQKNININENCPLYFFYDFTKGYNENDFDFIFGTDGIVTQDNNGLTVSSVPFKATIPIGNEHVKWLRFNKNVFMLSTKYETVFELVIAAEQVIDPKTIPVEFNPRIRNINDDIRLAAGAFNLIDPETWMVFDFIISNTAIYAFYERLPFSKPFFNGGILTPLGDYAAFSNAIWVARRSGVNPSNDYQKLAIGLNRSKGTVSWYINDIPVFTINTIGLRAHDKFRLLEVGGTETLVDVKSVRFGFGTFSLLDMALPNNYDRAYTVTVNNQREISASALVELDQS